MKQKILQWSNKHHINLVEEQLKHDELVLGSTDTVFGLFARCTLQGKAQLDTIKSRSQKPYIMLINSMDILNNWTQLNYKKELSELLTQAWPGPLTILLTAHQNTPEWLQSSHKTLAFRWPQHEGIQSLLKSFGILFSTSANISGHDTQNSYAELDPYLKEQFQSIILDDVEQSTGKSSTILDCTLWPFKIVRQGAYKI